MQTAQRQPATGVIRHLFDEAAQYQFRQALRLLLIWLRSQAVSYEDAFKHVLRFQNNVSLGFPASEIAALHAEFVAPQTDQAATVAPLRITLTPAFIGLLGTNGSLPFHYSERIAAHQLHDKDDSARAFLDLVSNRMVGLFFEAWGKYRLESRIDTHGVDPLRALLEQLGGFKTSERTYRGDGEDVLASFAALFRTRPMSAFAIAGALSDHFSLPIAIEQFVGCWDHLHGKQHTVLGTPEPALGHGATLGGRIWRRDRRIRLLIGPLGKAGRDACLPRGDTAKALTHMLRRFGLANLECEVRLILKPDCVTPVLLSADRPDQHRLGWGAFLTSSPGRPENAHVRYLLPMHAARSRTDDVLRSVRSTTRPISNA